jgi:hypothetical protein
VRQFWHGIYKSFWVKGPGKFYVRISRNSGINCILPGAFLDKLAGPACVSEDRAMPWMGGVRFRPEGVYLRGNKTAIAVEGDSGKGSSLGTPARLLWLLGNRCIVMGGGAEARRRDRVMAYRASLNASNGALSQYRWDLNVWSPIERAAFSRTMAVAHQSLSQANPIMKSLQY